MPTCLRCGVNPVPNDWEICRTCTTQKNLQRPARQAPRTAVPAPAWQLIYQSSSGLSSGGTGVFKRSTVTGFMGDVMACLATHQTDTHASSYGDQTTIWDGGGTATVDYQGTRAGSVGSLWIDLHGQYGSQNVGRKSYFEILVEVSNDSPLHADVEAAINQSV